MSDNVLEPKYPEAFTIAGGPETNIFIARDNFEADQIGMAFLAGFEEGSQCNPERKVSKDELLAIREAIKAIRNGISSPKNAGLFIRTKADIAKILKDWGVQQWKRYMGERPKVTYGYYEPGEARNPTVSGDPERQRKKDRPPTLVVKRERPKGEYSSKRRRERELELRRGRDD